MTDFNEPEVIEIDGEKYRRVIIGETLKNPILHSIGLSYPITLLERKPEHPLPGPSVCPIELFKPEN